MKRLTKYILSLSLVTSFLFTASNVSASSSVVVSRVVDVSRDQTSQNETPLAVNPLNSANLITGANDWNYNDGCGVNATLDGGRSWTATLPNGFLPGVTK